MVEVKKTKNMGRGVFATKNIKLGQIILEDDLLVFSQEDRTVPFIFYDFLYDGTKSAVALGISSLFNHSENPSVDYNIKKSKTIPKIVIHALRNIKKGEQLFINYGYDPITGEDL